MPFLPQQNVKLRGKEVQFSGQNSHDSLYFSLLAGNSRRMVRARLFSLPTSLKRREICLHCPENRGKWPQFRGSFFQTGPEKILFSTPHASFRASFSGGQTRSPVSTTPAGE